MCVCVCVCISLSLFLSLPVFSADRTHEAHAHQPAVKFTPRVHFTFPIRDKRLESRFRYGKVWLMAVDEPTELVMKEDHK